MVRTQHLHCQDPAGHAARPKKIFPLETMEEAEVQGTGDMPKATG